MILFLISAFIGGVLCAAALRWIHHHTHWHYIGLIQITLSGVYLVGIFGLAALLLGRAW